MHFDADEEEETGPDQAGAGAQVARTAQSTEETADRPTSDENSAAASADPMVAAAPTVEQEA